MVENCIHCDSEPKYSAAYDSHYCPNCQHWLERICPDRDCEFCADRPKYPPEIICE